MYLFFLETTEQAFLLSGSMLKIVSSQRNENDHHYGKQVMIHISSSRVEAPHIFKNMATKGSNTRTTGFEFILHFIPSYKKNSLRHNQGWQILRKARWASWNYLKDLLIFLIETRSVLFEQL